MKCVAIWGAGEFGQYVYAQIKNRNDYLISYFVDRNPDLVGRKIDGIEVISPERLNLSKELNIDIILTAFRNGLNTYNQLVELGEDIKVGIVKDQVFIQQLMLKENLLQDANIIWFESNYKPLLRHLETNIVDYCNLNCKGCSHFSNLYKVGDMVPFETYCRDLEQIAKKVNLLCFYMLGGEALLNERLEEYIIFSRKVFPYTEIWIVTNGLLIPKQESAFFDCCIENNIGLDITEYEPTARIRKQIVDILKEHNVFFRIRETVFDFGKNIDLEGCADKNEAMRHCRENPCHFFRNGNIYKCPFGALGNKFFEHYHLGIKLEDGINIYDKNLNWEKLIYQLDNESIDACKYCGNEVRFKWDISHKPVMEEWII